MNYKKIEIIANITLIVIGLLLGIIFFISDKMDLSLILFSIALACILYQFLGGIGEGNSFQLGAIKFGGAAAILIGFMFFLKKVVFVPTPEKYKLEISDIDWMPVSIETGRIKTIKIKSGGQEEQFPDESKSDYLNSRKNHEYQISDKANNQFSIELKSRPSDTIGFVNINNFKTKRLYNKTVIAENEKVMQIFTLKPEVDSLNSSNKIETVSLPFEIKVFKNSRFSIEPYYMNLEVVKRTSYIVPANENESYVVFLEQANSGYSNNSERFSKWLVKKIKHKMENYNTDE